MISRRQLIGGGMAVSTVGLGAGVARAFEASAPKVAGPGLHSARTVIVDTRFQEALDIALQAAAAGARIHALPRDVLELWHDHLAPAPGRPAQAFGGVTTEQGFFVLRTLAADHRQRVLYSAVHAVPGSAEPLFSWVIGPER